MRRAGRPPAFSRDGLLDAVDSFDYRHFTVAEVAQALGVRDSTVYNYVESREQLRALAAHRALAVIDLDGSPAAGWIDYLIGVDLQLRRLCHRHPGLDDYYLHGPYLAESVSIFDEQVRQVCRRRPEVDRNYAFVLAAHASTTTLSFLGSVDVSDDSVRRVLVHTLPALDAALAGVAPPGLDWQQQRRDLLANAVPALN